MKHFTECNGSTLRFSTDPFQLRFAALSLFRFFFSFFYSFDVIISLASLPGDELELLHRSSRLIRRSCLDTIQQT